MVKGLKFIHVGWKNKDMELFDEDHHYPYNFFTRLMDKLEAQSKTQPCSFWHNRNIILRHASDLVIVIDEKKEIVAFYIITDDDEIVMFEVFQQGKGIGRQLISRELVSGGRSLFVDESFPESTGFWERMGISYNRVTNH